jgi:hypothetical protein
MMASALLASAACLFNLKKTVAPERKHDSAHEYRRAVFRLSTIALPALLTTFWALLDGVAHRNHLAGLGAGTGASGQGTRSEKADAASSAHPGAGYESVILWPYPPKKQVVAPVDAKLVQANGPMQPLVIRFNGEYWYLQPPELQPGPHAHQAHGSPLDVHIASANSFPLMMQAHQFLRAPVRVSRCREIRMQIRSREMGDGVIAIAIWLKNSAATGASEVYLGERPVAGGNSDALLSPAGAAQTLVFPVPSAPRARKFDEISVMILPDSRHQRVGPRIAIEQFEIVPR